MANLICQRCNEVHGRDSRAKYCLACLPLVLRAQKQPKESRRVHSVRMDWGGPSYLGLTPDSHDWARLAAYIDGEGSINFSPKNGPGGVLLSGRVQVTNTDVRLMAWVGNVFGMKIHFRQTGQPERWKPCYWATAENYRGAWIAKNCMPWFVMKADQAQLLLDHQQTMGSWQRGSGIKTPGNVVEFRNSLRTKMRQLNRRGPAVIESAA